MPVCRVCEKRIRGNAGEEEYNEVKQEMAFTCQTCIKLMTSLLPKKEGAR